MSIRQSSPYQSNYKQMNLQTPPKSQMMSSPGTEKKEYNNLPQDHLINEIVKSQVHEVNVHKEILSQENANLRQDVEFWQGKVGHHENEKHLALEYKDQTHRSNIEVLKKGHGDQLILHQSEIDKLTQHLHDREIRIQELAVDLKQRCDDIDRLKLEVGGKDAELFRCQREINDLKQIADFKTGENEKLKNDKSELQIALYQTQQSEGALKDETQKQFGQNAALRDTLEKTAIENQESHSLKDATHSQNLNALHIQHANEKEALCSDINNHRNIIAQKEVEAAQLGNQLNTTIVNLNETSKNHQNAEALSRIWQDKHAQSEQEKLVQLDNARQQKDATVNQITRNHSIEKSGLQNQISGLSSALQNKEGELNNTKSAYITTEQNRKNLELHKSNLEGQLKEWMRKKDDADRTYTNQIKIQSELHNNQIKSNQQQADRDKNLLSNQILGLRQVVVSKDKEVNEQRTNSHMNAIRAQEHEKKYREASQEADVWKNQSIAIERQKSSELDAERNLRNSQISELARNHSNELQRQHEEKNALKGVISQKHSDLEQQKSHSAQLYNNIIQKEADIKNHLVEKSVWKSKAEQEAQLRSHVTNEAEQHKNQLRGMIIDKERQHSDLQNNHNALQSDLYSTQQEAQRRMQEAEAWRSRANEEFKIRSIDRAHQDDLHRSTTQKMQMSHENEKSHLHTNIQELHSHVQNKNQEAADWRRSYHANRYGKQ